MDRRTGRRYPWAARLWALHLIVLLVLTVVTCRHAALPLEGEAVSEVISSRDDGVVTHPQGAVLSIPAGALSRDTTVVITDEGTSPTNPYAPIFRVSRRFILDLGGAAVTKDMTLKLPYTDPRVPSGMIDVENLVLVSQVAQGIHRMSPAASEPRPDLHATARLRGNHEPLSDVARSFELQHIMPSTDQLFLALSPAPYYSQDGLQWCVPTLVAMLYNYRAWNPDVRLSNWHVAGLAKTLRDTTGVPPNGVMDKSGVKGLYAGYYWDADLIPSAPMTYFVQSITLGWDIVELFGSGQYAAVNKVEPGRSSPPPQPEGGDSTGTSS